MKREHIPLVLCVVFMVLTVLSRAGIDSHPALSKTAWRFVPYILGLIAIGFALNTRNGVGCFVLLLGGMFIPLIIAHEWLHIGFNIGIFAGLIAFCAFVSWSIGRMGSGGERMLDWLARTFNTGRRNKDTR